MKAVLISIQPKWCELIANGKKTVEVRKTKPKLETPFKVYIYCTNSKDMLWILRNNERNSNKIASIFTAKDVGGATKANGKVIGEFVCDGIECFTTDYRANKEQTERISKESCVSWGDLAEYEYNSHCLYGWHITDLVIYDKPKELSEFHKPCVVNPCVNRNFCSTGNTFCPTCTIKKPPQSWCYVERLGEG